MVTTKFYLDTRRKVCVDGKGEKPSVLKIAITKNRAVAYISLDVRLTSQQWNPTKEKV